MEDIKPEEKVKYWEYDEELVKKVAKKYHKLLKAIGEL